MAIKGTSATLLREVANALERHGESRVIAALKAVANESQQRRLPFNDVSKGKGVGRPSVRPEVVASLGDCLRVLDSREAGLRAVEDANLTRRELEALARHFDVPVRKDVRVPDLEELIVNVTIGARLNSQAIRGKGKV